MVTIDVLDRFVHTLSGNVFHIEFDRCGNGRLSVYADTMGAYFMPSCRG